MTIYDLKLYGVHMPRLTGESRVILSQERERVDALAPKCYRFEATVLKKYGSKEDVLCLQFAGRPAEYVTLYPPTLYLEDGEWLPSTNSKVAEAFLEHYKCLTDTSSEDKSNSIFDYIFYGQLTYSALSTTQAIVSLSKDIMKQPISNDSVLFSACVLKEFKGNKYVVRVKSGKETAYIPLFNDQMYYDETINRWEKCNKNPIPNKILKCYIKHMSE